MTELLLVVAVLLVFWLLSQLSQLNNRNKALEEKVQERNSTLAEKIRTIATLQKDNTKLKADLESANGEVRALAKYRQIVIAEAEAARIRAEANAVLEEAKKEASETRKASRELMTGKQQEAASTLQRAHDDADRLIQQAQDRAREIAGDAYEAQGKAKLYEDTVSAMRRKIEGYGDSWIIPTYSLLDELAEEFGYTDAGKELKLARERTRSLVEHGRAAVCDYVDPSRKKTAIQFVIDAFNGKVDSILSRGKADNHGKLAQEIRDAFTLVNVNGTAFRNAKISQEYLDSRLEELKWGATVRALKDREREEQRELREQIREEERARKEYEKAMRDAEKQEAAIKKAMEQMQKRIDAANEAQRAEYQTKLDELEAKLKEAEEKNQRALSMAQQTRVGHVYVISNIGSFGENVFKIGMTRRLEPKDRVRELGDASVPFQFDIHAMIYCEDAPTLEKELHRKFMLMQVNKVNPRKEFFRLGIKEIKAAVEAMNIDAHWTITAEALEYRESQRIEQQILENPTLEAEWERVQESVPLLSDEEDGEGA